MPERPFVVPTRSPAQDRLRRAIDRRRQETEQQAQIQRQQQMGLAGLSAPLPRQGPTSPTAQDPFAGGDVALRRQVSDPFSMAARAPQPLQGTGGPLSAAGSALDMFQRNVAEPAAGFALQTPPGKALAQVTGAITEGGQGFQEAGRGVEDIRRQQAAALRDQGLAALVPTNLGRALGEPYQQTDLPAGVKGTIEAVNPFDPTAWIPVPAAGPAARLAVKGTKAAVKTGLSAAEVGGRAVGQTIREARFAARGAPPAARVPVGGAGKIVRTDSPSIVQALDDWRGGRAYVDASGNYHLRAEGKPTGPIAPWNKDAKQLFVTSEELHKAAQRGQQATLPTAPKGVTPSVPSAPVAATATPPAAAAQGPAPTPRPQPGRPRVAKQVSPPHQVYHGSQRVFESFDPGKANHDALYGPGAYFTEDPGVASGYARTRRGGEGAPNVTPASLNIQRPFDADAAADQKLVRILQEVDQGNPGHWDNGLDFASIGNLGDIKKNEEIYRVLQGTFGDKGEVNDWLSANGFDSITHIGGKRTGTTSHRVWIVLPDDTGEFGGRIQAGSGTSSLITTPQPQPVAAGPGPMPPAPPSATVRQPAPPQGPQGPVAPPPATTPPGRGGQPPVPGGTPPTSGGAPPLEPKEVVAKFVKVLRAAKPARSITEAEVTTELGKRAAKARAALARGDRVGAFAAFKGELPKTADIESLATSFAPEEGLLLRNMVLEKFRESPFKFLQADTAFTQLFDTGRIPVRSQIAVLEEVFGKEFVDAVLSLRRRGEKAWELFREIINVPRAMMATADLSATLRQGGLRLLDPQKTKGTREAFTAQLRAARSEANAKAIADGIAAHPMYESSQRAGLDLTMPSTVRAATPGAREEPFIGARLLRKVPLWGKVVDASERAYVTFLNKLRFDTFTHEAQKLGPGAKTDDLKSLAKTINILTGRGDLGKFTEASQVLSGLFFAPRFAVSRFQVPITLATGSSASRKLAARSLVSYASTVTAMLALADISGTANVDWDPRSSDFGKARFGKTRIDPWMGLQQPAVLVSRLASTKTRTLNTREVMGIEAGTAIQRFFESKMTPSMRLLLNRGEGFGGEPALGESPVPKVPRVVFDNFVPLFLQDLLEAIGEHGAPGAVAGPIAFFGMGAQTFGTDFELAVMESNQAFNELQGVQQIGLVLGQVAPSMKIDGVKIEWASDEQAKLQRLYAEQATPVVQQVISSLSGLTPEQQKDVLQKILSQVREGAREQMLAERFSGQQSPAVSSQPPPTAQPTQAQAAPLPTQAPPAQSNPVRGRLRDRARQMAGAR